MRNNWERRVIPKWRSSSVHASLQDNLPLQRKDRKRSREFFENFSEELQQRLAEWRRNPDFGGAADLLNFSHISAYKELLVEPAQYLSRGQRKLSSQLSSIVKSVLGIDEYHPYGQKDFTNAEISRQKVLIEQNPRAAIPYVDIARLYVINNQLNHANRAIFTAVALAPDNRYVLRSASRFYIHNGDADRASHLLRRTARTQEDPWLLASLIAIETIQGKSPTYFKRARAMLEGMRYDAVHLSELGAALATLHLDSGHIKDARRLFNRSLSNPNDNAVAQAVWAANEFSMNISIAPEWLANRYSSEAAYYTHEKSGNYSEALKNAQAWFDDEPFSTRPLQAGAFAASILGKYEIAEDQIKQALVIDPSSIDSKNNLAFSFMVRNRLSEAVVLLAEVHAAEIRNGGKPSGHTLANIGMLYYRMGDVDHGYKFYEKAVTALDNARQSSSKKIALAYWAQEAAFANDHQLPEVVNRAMAALAQEDSVAAKIVLARALKKEVPNENNGSAYKSLVHWEHDKSKNILIATRRLPFKN